ncbi:hypothetical protein [Arthrobacter sp. efr-133-R2A-63]|uniref:hypothetical protein n=1 Tax=Arthrobacter sp. efr-133-R2A-63 TaxID=3040278 RepID=UPI00254B0A2E|nr:hypothetical protein [Arthrobacter sp. efr-133-R2A-63]
MAQNLSIEDVEREVRTVFAQYDQDRDAGYGFCQARNGVAVCDRFIGHNGPHAWLSGVIFDRVLNYWRSTRLVTWR